MLNRIRKPNKERIKSFESVLLRQSGMRGTTEHEIVMKEGNAEVSLYRIRYTDGNDQRVPEERSVCSEEAVVKLLNDCDLLSWDGFKGPHPKHVKDGIMFILNAIVNDNRTIHAEGSENFPKHYRELTDGLHAILFQAKNEASSG